MGFGLWLVGRKRLVVCELSVIVCGWSEERKRLVVRILQKPLDCVFFYNCYVDIIIMTTPSLTILADDGKYFVETLLGKYVRLPTSRVFRSTERKLPQIFGDVFDSPLPNRPNGIVGLLKEIEGMFVLPGAVSCIPVLIHDELKDFSELSQKKLICSIKTEMRRHIARDIPPEKTWSLVLNVSQMQAYWEKHFADSNKKLFLFRYPEETHAVVVREEDGNYKVAIVVRGRRCCRSVSNPYEGSETILVKSVDHDHREVDYDTYDSVAFKCKTYNKPYMFRNRTFVPASPHTPRRLQELDILIEADKTMNRGRHQLTLSEFPESVADLMQVVWDTVYPVPAAPQPGIITRLFGLFAGTDY